MKTEFGLILAGLVAASMVVAGGVRMEPQEVFSKSFNNTNSVKAVRRSMTTNDALYFLNEKIKHGLSTNNFASMMHSSHVFEVNVRQGDEEYTIFRIDPNYDTYVRVLDCFVSDDFVCLCILYANGRVTVLTTDRNERNLDKMQYNIFKPWQIEWPSSRSLSNERALLSKVKADIYKKNGILNLKVGLKGNPAKRFRFQQNQWVEVKYDGLLVLAALVFGLGIFLGAKYYLRRVKTN